MTDVRYHFSPVTNGWERCGAIKRGCKYGGSHLSGAEVGKREAQELKADFHPLGVNELYGGDDQESLVVEEARRDLDFYEYYADHPGFIAEAGGQDVFDAELTRRFNRFYTLNSRSAA